LISHYTDKQVVGLLVSFHPVVGTSIITYMNLRGLPYPFPFWVIAEPKRQPGRQVTAPLANLNLVEVILHPRPWPSIAYFYAERDW